jgi:predicted DNA binding CopG/RHH family protein
MSTHPYIAARVTPEMKALVRELARRDQITESALVKRLLEVVLQTANPGAPLRVGAPRLAPRAERLHVRLNPEDRILLADRAAARGMPSATYVSVLVRAHLRGVVPLPKEELLALKRSIADLGVVVRHLSQILRAIQLGKAPATGREVFAQTHKIALVLWERFRDLLKANERSWSEGHRAPGG